MKLEVINISYSEIASNGLDGLIREKAGRDNGTGLACHKGIRRSIAGVHVLSSSGIPVANRQGVLPTINYSDFMNYNFTTDEYGLSVPGKTDFSFRNLVLFHDGDGEEVSLYRKIFSILELEAYPNLARVFLAYVRDEDGLLAME